MYNTIRLLIKNKGENMTYQSEKELEDLLIKQLEKQGYNRVSINNEEDAKGS